MIHPQQKVFFIGIGGSGMSSLAHILIDEKFAVSGYDKSDSVSVNGLKERGVPIFRDAGGIIPENYDLVVFSTATKKNTHPVYRLFSEAGRQLLHRSEMLHLIFGRKQSIAVAGSHGKTTTTTMLAQILLENAMDPSVMVGGELSFMGNRGGRSGNGPWGVYESDESDGTFTNHKADISIVTNIDNDHMDYYKNLPELYKAFGRFIAAGNPGQRSIVCLNDPGVTAAIALMPSTTGITGYTDSEFVPEGIAAVKYTISNDRIKFTYKNSEHSFKLPVPGDHYLKNALAAVIAADFAGVPVDKSVATLVNYKGVKRRMDLLGEFNGCRIYDDYGHHPTEIRSVLQSAGKMLAGNGRLLIVFQPHRYSRTSELLDDFAAVLAGVEHLYLLPIYPAGEDPLPGITSAAIIDRAGKGSSAKLLSGNVAEDCLLLKNALDKNDILVCLGAGNVRDWGIYLAGLK